MKKQNFVILLCVLLTITFSIGYSIFRTSIDVVGKTAAMKDINVVFYSVEKTDELDSDDATAYINEDNKELIINVPKLKRKGAYTKYLVTVKNTGSIPVKLETINEYGTSVDDLIKITYDGIGITDEVINPGQTTTFNIKVSLDNSLTEDYVETEFQIRLNYIQA